MASLRHLVCVSVGVLLFPFAARATLAAGPTPIAIGEDVVASLDVVGERDLYTFDAAAGDVIWIRMTIESSFIEPRMFLTAPGGGGVAGSAGTFTSDILDLTLTETGAYTLETYDNLDNETGAYSVQVIRIADGTPVSFGPPGCGTTDTNSNRDVYTFDATAGDLVWLRVAGFRPQARLYGPDDTIVISGSTTNTTSDILDFVLPATGTYSLVVYSNSFNATDYCYHLLRISDPVDDIFIEFGPVYADAIATLGEIDAFTFDAAAGDVVWIRMRKHGSFIDQSQRLYDPAGNLIATGTTNILDLTLPSTGTYTLLAFDDFSNETGAYDLELLRISDPVDAIVTDFGPILCGDLEGDTQRIAYQVDGVAGDVVWFRIVTPTATQPRLRLYGPDFAILATSNTNNTVGDVLDFVLPATGVYTLVAYSDNPNASEYCVHGLRISNPNDDVLIEYGPVTVGDLDGLADIDAYTFSADAGDVAWIRMTRQGGFIEPRLRLYGPGHTLIVTGGAFTTVSDILDFTMPDTGTYTLLAYDSNSNEAGAYSLHLLRENDPTDAVELIFGAEHCASLEEGAIDAYTFPALTGDSIRARMSEETAVLEPRLRLLDPDGTFITSASGNPTVELLATDLPADGVYKLLAYDDTSNDPGDYRVEVELCVEDPCGDFCPADITNDRDVGFADILAILGGWGSCDCCPADIDGDGVVGFAEILIVLGAWGPCL